MKYPVGIQSFEDLRTNGYVYVDKTALIHRLAGDGKYYFLSRPRRFGKSLLISTMEAYFLGKRELFEGLAIENLEQDWTEYPVLHLDLNTRDYTDSNSLKDELKKHLVVWESKYGDRYGDKAVEERFFQIINLASEKTGRKVVVLVDEYDKPLLQTIDNEALQNEYRNTLRAFYSVLKTQDRYIRFAFLTGVTKFSKVSVFSDLNNLNDISLDIEYESLCGISADEVDSYFTESIQNLADARKMSFEDARNELKRRFDGYHFSENLMDMYNPFSLLNTFSKNRFSDYWFESGTPTFLVKLLRANDIPLKELDEKVMDATAMGNVDVMKTNPMPVLYQSGYLTIKSYDSESELYTLTFPNEEVKKGFLNYLLPYYANVDATSVAFNINGFITDIRKGDVDMFMRRLQSFFAGYNYELIPRHDLERHYQNVLFTVCKLVGLRVEAEFHTSAGRVDMVLKTSDSVYLFELKLNAPCTDALAQINDKGYAWMYATDPRRIVKIGVEFDTAIRGIKEWTIATNNE